METIETPLYFTDQNGYRLFGVYHSPSQDTRNTGIVLIHPFAEEKLWAHRVLVNFARFLAAKGYSCLRFDFMGHGDSEGGFEAATVETRVSNIECAVNKLREISPLVTEVGLVGLRFGATLAALKAQQSRDIAWVVLWEPVVNGEKYMQQILRSNLATQSAIYKEIRYTREDLIDKLKSGNTINIDGYPLAWEFFSQASAVDLSDHNRMFVKRSLGVQIHDRKKNFSNEMTKLKKVSENMTIKLVKEKPFWRETKYFCSKAEALYATTFSWMIEHE